MKKKIILLAIALVATLGASAQNTDTVQLPYTANFTQGWTATGGATIISNDSVRLNGNGQKIVSPSIVVPDSARLFFCWVLRRDNPDGSTSYMQLNDSVDFQCRIASVDRYSNIQLDHTYINYYDELQSRYAGQTIQIEFEYTDNDTIPIYLTSVILFQYDIQASFEAPAFAYIGDTVEFIPQVSVPAGDTVDAIWWYYRNDAGSWLYGGEEDTLRLSWSTPGTYNIELGANKHNVYAGKQAAVWFYSSITIFDTTTVDCDSISLPYTADFTQCWTAEGGATIIDPNHVSLTSQGQKLTGPWMESAPGKIFFRYGMSQANDGNWSVILLKIESEEGVVTSREEFPGYNWGNFITQFNSPGGRIRLVIEYTGSQALSDFSFGNVQFYSYQIENAIEGPGIVHVGDTVTFTAHATLQDDEVADYYNWYMYVYNSNGSIWVDENDPSRTIVSSTDSTLVVVWNTPGRYSITSSVSKYNVYHNGSAYANDQLYYIKVVDYPFYEEDSIYYTSTAKDTVIGCHPQLHNALLPEGVTVIADSAFFNLSNLSSVSMPDGLEYIGKMAFAWNQGLTEITLPRDLQYIGDNAFWWDTNITVVNFNAENCLAITTGFNDNGYYSPAFIGCNNLTTIHFGERVKRIPDFAFGDCYNLTGTLVIPDSVTYIGSYAFYHWRRDNPRLDVVLGRSVSEIGEYAFCFFHHDNTFTIRNANPPSINQHSFDDENGSMYTTLFVPCGSRNAYQNAPYWRGCFADIIEDCNGIEEIDLGDDIKVYVDNDNILVSGANGLSVNIYDVMGRRVGSKQKAGNGALRLSVPTTGVYLVKIGDYHAQKVVVCW